ncbi:hypothetical protein BC938DRAFT_478786 [Jimgerdemannia flammicorona]|uniref:Uncharacterized protein n=1 Tax=Jimgerdemannia flammicorona TaxID=994334 RepID=A0A433QMB2_9FUNG|nr:hypothetical protein BC938DRAFT_478786 [Jimgerdemannia flammicorona]
MLHGKTSAVKHDEKGLFRGVPRHSLPLTRRRPRHCPLVCALTLRRNKACLSLEGLPAYRRHAHQRSA